MVDVETKIFELSAALESHLGIKAAPFTVQMKQAVRRLPRRLRPQLRLVTEAEAAWGNPRLQRQMDDKLLNGAFEALLGYIKTVDRGEVLRGRVLTILAVIAFQMILVFTAFVVFFRMRGVL